MTSKECCRVCRYFKLHDVDNPQSGGICRRYPPQAKILYTRRGRSYVRAALPGTLYYHWCGEFAQKVD